MRTYIRDSKGKPTPPRRSKLHGQLPSCRREFCPLRCSSSSAKSHGCSSRQTAWAMLLPSSGALAHCVAAPLPQKSPAGGDLEKRARLAKSKILNLAVFLYRLAYHFFAGLRACGAHETRRSKLRGLFPSCVGNFAHSAAPPCSAKKHDCTMLEKRARLAKSEILSLSGFSFIACLPLGVASNSMGYAPSFVRSFSPFRCRSSSAKSHARFACSVASALATAHCRYQLFAG